MYGNTRRRGGDVITMEMKGSYKVLDNQDGSYKVSYIPEAFGQFVFKLLVNGDQITGSPFTANVLPGKTSAAKSKVVGLPQSIKCGEAGSFTIEARDQFDNLQDKGDHFIVEFTGPASFKGDVANKGNGLYGVSCIHKIITPENNASTRETPESNALSR
jgi:hypothetical protein